MSRSFVCIKPDGERQREREGDSLLSLRTE